MKWLVVVCLLASPAAAGTIWTVQTYSGEQIGLDVETTSTGYVLRLHERHDFYPVQWANVHCPGTSVMEAGAPLIGMTRKPDGTFAVTMYKAMMYSFGPGGVLGVDPVMGCV